MCVCFEKEGVRAFETQYSMIFLGIRVVSTWVETQLERLRGDISLQKVECCRCGSGFPVRGALREFGALRTFGSGVRQMSGRTQSRDPL